VRGFGKPILRKSYTILRKSLLGADYADFTDYLLGTERRPGADASRNSGPQIGVWGLSYASRGEIAVEMDGDFMYNGAKVGIMLMEGR
jgi:hypothetical protein